MSFILKHTFYYKLFIELLVIEMFEQMAVMAAKSNAALFIFLMLFVLLLGVVWARIDVYEK